MVAISSTCCDGRERDRGCAWLFFLCVVALLCMAPTMCVSALCIRCVWRGCSSAEPCLVFVGVPTHALALGLQLVAICVVRDVTELAACTLLCVGWLVRTAYSFIGAL